MKILTIIIFSLVLSSCGGSSSKKQEIGTPPIVVVDQPVVAEPEPVVIEEPVIVLDQVCEAFEPVIIPERIYERCDHSSCRRVEGLIPDNRNYGKQNSKLLSDHLNLYKNSFIDEPENSNFFFDDSITVHNQDTKIYWHSNAKFTPTSELNWTFLRFLAADQNVNTGSLEIHQPNIDMTEVTSSNVQNRGTGIAVNFTHTVLIKNANVYSENRGGDSGIATTGVRDLVLDNVKVSGFADCSIYASGGIYSYNGYPETKVIIKNSEFVDNNVGVCVKRRVTFLDITNSIFTDNGNSMLSGQTGNNFPGTKIDAYGNEYHNTSNSVVLSQASRGLDFYDNKITIGDSSLSVTHKRSWPLFDLQGGEAVDTISNNCISDQRSNKTIDVPLTWNRPLLLELPIYQVILDQDAQAPVILNNSDF